MQRLFRAWKARLHTDYLCYATDEERLSHRPEDVQLDGWKYLVKYFGSEEFKDQLHQLVVEQQSEEVENPMTREEMYSSILGERPGYVRGFGYGKKPPIKTQMQQANIEASVSFAMEIMRQEMQAGMDRKLQEELNRKLQEELNRKLQEEHEQMDIDLKRDMEQDLQNKLKEERAHMKGEFDKMFQEQIAAFMTRMQQVLALALAIQDNAYEEKSNSSPEGKAMFGRRIERESPVDIEKGGSQNEVPSRTSYTSTAPEGHTGTPTPPVPPPDTSGQEVPQGKCIKKGHILEDGAATVVSGLQVSVCHAPRQGVTDCNSSLAAIVPEWQAAMRAEFDALDANRIWDIFELPMGKKPIG
ncbi:uncharacterized protein LOC132619695 [Lycium barbarum]|uniref:uncharacterized protein LOC132619695 n=1 Tax=Lycium barbarum TaxID=112863 RepID=UPI00293F0373|nr:uncharacterized protein LOC132619695 [Lycium barbarum]